MDLIERQDAIDAANDWLLDCIKVQKQDRSCGLIRRLEDLPPAQPELIAQDAYVRGFEQGRTQGMIDSQGGKK